jgi:glycine hydroxymethyltransferase
MILTSNETSEILLENMPKPKTMAQAIDAWVFPGGQGGPLMHVIAAKAVAFGEALKPEFKVYQQQVVDNAAVLAETLLSEGFKLVTGGTDNHLILMDLSPKKLSGKASEKALEAAGITTNKNMVPNDPQKPFITSGIRVGTPALTTRGMKTDDMVVIGKMISRVLNDQENELTLTKVREEVAELTSHFPLYQIPV